MQEVSATWPGTLPPPNIDGYGVSPDDNIGRTDMESGAARQRRRFIDVPSKINVSWDMSNYQMAVFEGWQKWEAREGAAWFNIDLKSGLGFTNHIARFVGQYNAVPIRRGLAWSVTAELEVRSRPVLTEGATAIVISEDPDGLFAAIDSFNTLVNTTLPGIEF